jgi:hypothetical protein
LVQKIISFFGGWFKTCRRGKRLTISIISLTPNGFHDQDPKKHSSRRSLLCPCPELFSRENIYLSKRRFTFYSYCCTEVLMASATDTICNSNIWSILAYPAAVNYFSQHMGLLFPCSWFRITTYIYCTACRCLNCCFEFWRIYFIFIYIFVNWYFVQKRMLRLIFFIRLCAITFHSITFRPANV